MSKKLDVRALPALEDWPDFLMVVEHDESVWIGVGPDSSTRIENYTGWKYLSTIGHSVDGIKAFSVPGAPGRCGGRWWNVSAQAQGDFKPVIEKVRRLLASDRRDFIYLKNGHAVVGNLPEVKAPGRAVLVTLGEHQVLTFPADAPGAREFAMAGGYFSPELVGGMLMYTQHLLPIANLPEELQPLGGDAAVASKLPVPHARVGGQGWLCTIHFMLAVVADGDEDNKKRLTAESSITLAIVSKDAPAPFNKKGEVQFPASEWPQWSAWMQWQGISWTTEPGCDPDAPWNRPVDEDKLARLPGWKTPASNGLRLREFQKNGVRFAITRGMRALLGDDMGLGKTVQSIMAALYHQAQRVVVVAPASVRGVWESELFSWGAATSDQIQLLRDGLDHPKDGTKWLVCSYDQITTRNLPWHSATGEEHEAIAGLLKKLGVQFWDNHEDDDGVHPVKKKNSLTFTFPEDEAIPDDTAVAIRENLPKKRQTTWDRFVNRRKGMILRSLGDWGPDLVIFDEGHRLKNSDAKRTAAGIHLSGISGGCLLLSGTPIQNRTAEPAVLLHVLDPVAYQEVKNGERITIERIKGLLKPSMIRRLKSEVLTQLPPVVEQVIPLAGDGLEEIGNRIPEDVVDLQTGQTVVQALEVAGHAVLDSRERANPDIDPVERTEYNVLRAAWATGPARPTDDPSDQPLPPLSLFEMVRTRLGLAKAQASQTADLVADILENRGCLVVFTAHHAAADHLANHLSKHWKTVVMDGRTPPHKRTEIVDTFQSGGIDCLIAGMDAAGEGITLHRADTCLFLEMATKPSTIRQARDRLHRIGQKSTVQAIYLVADNPVDRFFRDLCLDKAALVGNVLEEEVRVLGESRGAGKSKSEPELEHIASVHGDEIAAAPYNISGVEATAHGEKNTPNRKADKKKHSLSAKARLEKLDERQKKTEERLRKILDQRRQREADGEPELTERRDEMVTDIIDDEVTDTSTNSAATSKKRRRAAQWENQHQDKVKQQTAARVRRYRERHPEKHKEGMKAYRQEHKAESRAYMREYRKDNEDLKAKHREYMRAWRARQKAIA